jgi:hypothetical protein
VQAVNAELSRLHVAVAPSVRVNENDASVDVPSAGFAVIATVGVVRIVQVLVALTVSSPLAELTVNVCGPAARPEYETGLEHPCAGAESSEQLVAPPRTLSNENVAVVETVVSVGCDMTATLNTLPAEADETSTALAVSTAAATRREKARGGDG